MWKQVAVSVACALLVTATASGNLIEQNQGSMIGTTNGINLLQSDENGSSSQVLVVNITQDGGGISHLFGSAHLIGITMPVTGLSGISTMTGVANGLMGSGLISPWTANSLGDQARLHLLMLSMH